MRKDVAKAFPTIFCRQLDHVQRVGEKILVVNDTSQEEDFAIMNIQTKTLRRDKEHIMHTEHTLKNLKPLIKVEWDKQIPSLFTKLREINENYDILFFSIKLKTCNI